MVVARARDPYFPPWPDVVQLNAFAPAARTFLARTLVDIAEQADGVRCDMAMLLLDDVFEATWGDRVGERLGRPLWVEVLDAVRIDHPSFCVVAEAYWGREPDLLAQGFDACYDKTLYDRLVGGSAGEIRAHLAGLDATNSKTVRFLENHDEPRAAATVRPADRERAASVVLATLPGTTLWHEGQLDGRRVRLPVFLGRRPEEELSADRHAFLAHLIAVAPARPGARRCVDAARDRRLAGQRQPRGAARLELGGTVGAVARRRQLLRGPGSGGGASRRELVVAPGRLQRAWTFTDALTGTTYERDGADLAEHGLFVDLPPWALSRVDHRNGVTPPA